MLDTNIRSLYQKPVVHGDIGIEVEMETTRDLLNHTSPHGWVLVGDGSLRGFSGEFVTDGPIPHADVAEAVGNLFNHVTNTVGAEILHSVRASVHIHINVQELTFNQIINMALLYYILETPLTKYCGPNREGNLFCLRLLDAEFLMQVLLRFCETSNLDEFMDETNIRYGSVNFSAIPKHGSLEFRSMETDPSLTKIVPWVNILCKMRQVVMDKTFDIRSVPLDISHLGPYTWVSRTFGAEVVEMLNYQDFDRDVIASLRNLQLLIYR